MRIDIYHYFDTETTVTKKLDKILTILKDIQRKEVIDMALLDDLKANVANLVTSVAANGALIPSIVAAIKGLTDQMGVLSQQLADAIAANDPAAIQAASDAIAAQNQAVIAQTAALAAAIPANTPAAAIK